MQIRSGRSVVGTVIASVLTLSVFHNPLFGQSCPGSGSIREAEFKQVFDEYGVDGTLVVTGRLGQVCITVNPQRAQTRYLPASTFKIFNTMVALDEGSIPDEFTVLPWDGVDRGSPAWNEDQDMRTAFRRSTVWFYQELARRTGADRMKWWLLKERYGNADVSGGIDRFWLSGGLRISPDEQVTFLRRLYNRDLGFSARAQEVAIALLAWEQNGTYELFGKTGWTEMNGRQLGWVVGFVETRGSVYYYALNFESPDPDFPMPEAREKILRELLARLGILPATREPRGQAADAERGS